MHHEKPVLDTPRLQENLGVFLSITYRSSFKKPMLRLEPVKCLQQVAIKQWLICVLNTCGGTMEEVCLSELILSAETKDRLCCSCNQEAFTLIPVATHSFHLYVCDLPLVMMNALGMDGRNFSALHQQLSLEERAATGFFLNPFLPPLPTMPWFVWKRPNSSQL